MIRYFSDIDEIIITSKECWVKKPTFTYNIEYFCILLVQHACHTFHLLDTCSSLGDKQGTGRHFGANYLWGYMWVAETYRTSQGLLLRISVLSAMSIHPSSGLSQYSQREECSTAGTNASLLASATPLCKDFKVSEMLLVASFH